MTDSRAKPKAAGTSRASKPRKPTTKRPANATKCPANATKDPAKAIQAPVKSAKVNYPPKPGKQGAVILLSSGNPQIAKADGDAPVQAYIAAMPGWKSDLGKRLDALIERHVPHVCKAVKWNTPFYGIEGQGWFLGFYTYTHYVQVTFFRGTSLRPVPPVASKSEGTRYVNIRAGEFDEAQMASWIQQAAALPGVIPWQ